MTTDPTARSSVSTPAPVSTVREVKEHQRSALTTALRVLGDRAPEAAAELQAELDQVSTHLDAVAAFQERVRFGSAMSHHAEDVMTWLIEQGWTPPSGVLLLDHHASEEPA